jgi:hypothetical protein
MRTIENARQLREEIVRLKQELEEKENKVREGLKAVREDFRPENMILKTLSSVTGIHFAKSDFLKNGLMATVSIIIHRLLTKQESILEKKLIGWISDFTMKIRDTLAKFGTSVGDDNK